VRADRRPAEPASKTRPGPSADPGRTIPDPAVGTEYYQRREDGQLMLLHLQGS